MPQPPPNATGKILAILIIFLYLYSAPDPYAGNPTNGFHSPREQYDSYLARQRHALDVLNSSRYGDFRPERDGSWMNLTGFGGGTGYAWEELERVKEKVDKEHKAIMGEEGDNTLAQQGVYRNVTGVVQGKWVRSADENKELVDSGRGRMNLSDIAPGVQWGYVVWNRNITGHDGHLMLVIEEKDEHIRSGKHGIRGGSDDEGQKDLVREVSATMTIGDESTSGDGWEMRLHGVHWPEKGAMVMTTTSAKFAGIFGLPHLTTNKQDFESSQRLLNRTLDEVLTTKEKSVWIDLSDPWSTDDSVPVPHCEYLVYVQIRPLHRIDLHGVGPGVLTDDLASEINNIEAELRFPNGAPTPQVPPLQMSALIFSPDCGFMLESKGPPNYAPVDGEHLLGLKQEVYVQRVKRWSLIWGFALFGQVLLIRTQMKESSTPSTLSRISRYTVGMMLAVDFALFGCLMLMAASAPSVFPTATLAAFAVSLSLGLGIRFLADINNVQEPERRERRRERVQSAQRSQPQQNRTQATAPVITAAGADSLPLPGIAPRPSSNDIPIIIPSDQDVDAEIAEVENTTAALPTTNQTPRPPQTTARYSIDITASYGQLVMLFMCFFLLTGSSASWPTPLRSAYFNTLAFLYLSFWLPQIYRNTKRNSRKAFLWKFVIGQSVLRAAPFAYFFLDADNVLFADTRLVSMFVLAAWLWLQVWVLVAQEVLGPRFGLPQGWLPEAWDYHHVLREGDAEGGGMPIGIVRAPGSPRLEKRRSEEVGGRKRGDTGSWSLDCAICMQGLEIPVVPTGEDRSSGAGGVAGMLARRAYMVTPCRHAFHSTCLEGWMRFRLQCPICRENLPPL